MADVTGPLNTLPGTVRKPPKGRVCDDCVSLLSIEISGKHDIHATEIPWWKVPELQEEYDRRKALLPPATRRVQGETDSFGAEWADLCDNCYEKDRLRRIKERNEIQVCDWCEKRATCSPARDFDEGSSGPVYYVCLECHERQDKALMDEYERYQDRYE